MRKKLEKVCYENDLCSFFRQNTNYNSHWKDNFAVGIHVTILILGVCILLRVWDPGDGRFIPSTQRYYRRLFLLFNIT
jgi:hypothetical protein